MSAGSLHSDQWTGPAVNLLTRNLICIKVGGWWYNRANAEVRAQKTRTRSLSLRSDENEVDLHTPISNMIETDIGVAIVIPTRPPQ